MKKDGITQTGGNIFPKKHLFQPSCKNSDSITGKEPSDGNLAVVLDSCLRRNDLVKPKRMKIF
jgi:hypothetical protein